MNNKLKACEEFWAMFVDLFHGIRGIDWKNIVGNAIMHYIACLTFQMLFFSEIPISEMFINSLYGVVFGGAFGAAGNIPKNKPNDELEITKYIRRANEEKHRVYREGLNSLPTAYILELLFWKITGVLHFMVLDFKNTINGPTEHTN